MQKKKKLTIVCAVVFVALLVTGFLFIIRPADGASRERAIRAKSCPGESVMEISIVNRSIQYEFEEYGMQYFEFRKPLETIKEICSEQGISCAEIVSNRIVLLLWQENADGYRDYYLIQHNRERTSLNYIFSGLSVTVNDQQQIPYPLHLMSDLRLQGAAAINIKEYMPYEFTGKAVETYQKISEFYRDIGYHAQEGNADGNRTLSIKPGERQAGNSSFHLTIKELSNKEGTIEIVLL